MNTIIDLRDMSLWFGLIWMRTGTSIRYWEYSNEFSGSIKGGEIDDKLSNL
jgi:hypothetical protein